MDSIQGKHFSIITDPQGVNTVIYRITNGQEFIR